MMKRILVEKNILAILFLLAGIALVLIGLKNGQVQSVLSKATRVCMECIGIG